MALIDLRDKLHIYVTGYPRSGTTWISRTLARALLCPAVGPWGSENLEELPPGVEGLQRRSKYVVRRSHFTVDTHTDKHTDHETHSLIMPVRDPRDVAVSAWHHFTFQKTPEDLARCVRQLCGLELGKPLIPDCWGGRNRHGWPGFVEDWLNEGIPIIRYEDHLADPIAEVGRLLNEIGLSVPARRIPAAVEANRWGNRKKDRLGRKGTAGQWHEALPPELADMIVEHCGDVMERLGYLGGDANMLSIEELRELVVGLKHLDAPGLSEKWQEHRKTVREHIIAHDVRDFLNWAVIQATMFVGDAPYVPEKLAAMRKERKGWRRWRTAMMEDDFGGALRLPGKDSWTSGNLINQGSHLRIFEQLTGLDIRNMQAVADFASGYGAAAKIIRRLGFNGPLATYEMPEMAALQRFYLENVGIDDVQSTYHLGEFMRVLDDGGLFVSICGLSETSPEFRTHVLDDMKATAYLIIYSPVWDGEDNEAFFSRFVEQHPELSWHRGNCIHTHRYLVGAPK